MTKYGFRYSNKRFKNFRTAEKLLNQPTPNFPACCISQDPFNGVTIQKENYPAPPGALGALSTSSGRKQLREEPEISAMLQEVKKSLLCITNVPVAAHKEENAITKATPARDLLVPREDAQEQEKELLAPTACGL